ncbi:MAG: reverse transcriptase domain-containing protein [Anaerolineaceae bacterium]|nr:reverse transcriptase domain-containing protein [Anaerolineaceae bacterium]
MPLRFGENMEKLLEKIITQECEKLITRHYEYLFDLNENIRRKEKRLDSIISKEVKFPYYWNIDEGFNPFKVNSKKRIEIYAYTLSKKIKENSYQPKTSIIHRIDKPSGGYRDLNIFQIPDSAISNFVYKSVLAKNLTLLSNYAYAYREDRNAHDAILRISSDWNTVDRIFVAEFDFSKFFDKISHDYLLGILNNRNFLLTDLERFLISQFLHSSAIDASNYDSEKGKIRTQGIPQGTSISLFLANIACWELDQEFENIGVKFARYADDTIIWSNSYEKVIRSYDAIDHFGKLMGVPINHKKSEGISVISEEKEEIRSKPSIKYLGYALSLRNISIGEKSIHNIKKKISYIIYSNLLQPLIHGIYNDKRITNFDWDYITTLAQLRRYMYGGLDDTKLKKFRFGEIKSLHFRGVMSYFPIVNDERQLKGLDGWLINSLKQTLRKRKSLFLAKGISYPEPISNWIENISEFTSWQSQSSKPIYDLRIPSFLFINKAMQKGLKSNGLKSITNPKSIYYSGSFRKISSSSNRI